MTSFASTGRCPSSISPPSRTRIPSGPWKHMWWELDAEALERLGQLLWVVEGVPVVVPPVRGPDLRVVARPDDHGLGTEADRRAEVRREQDPALAVHLGLDGLREDEPLEQPRALVGQRQCGDLGGKVIPYRLGMDCEAVVQPARDHR